MSTINERVQAGIALLDEKGPADWRERIDFATLNLQSRRNCVLGQIYGYYNDGLRELGVTQFDFDDFPGAPYGFMLEKEYFDYLEDMEADYTEGGNTLDAAFRELSAAWKAALA
jgi:hypothetical protein